MAIAIPVLYSNTAINVTLSIQKKQQILSSLLAKESGKA
jgi:hypothetical protein